jgi:hypothetical protein
MHWRDMNTGTKISAAGHGALIVWALLGGVLFKSRETQFEFANVSVISEAEFASLREAAAPAEQPASPVAGTSPPPPRPAPPEPAPEEPPPDPVPEPVPEEVPPEPAPPEPPPPEPDPEPQPVQPDVSPDAGSTVLENQSEQTPAPQQADIVAEEETPAPEEPVEEAPVEQEATQPDPAEEPEVVTEETAPAAPEETTTAIITEADTQAAGGGALAPERSLRPRSRPERVAAAEPPPQPADAPAEAPSEAPAEPDPPEPDTSVEDAIAAAAADAVAAALAEAQSDTAAPATGTGGQGTAASGPPLTGGERDAFRLAVQRCWVIDPGSEASRVSVTLAFSLDPSGRISAGPTLLTNSGGSDSAVRTAFEAARRAVVRCGASGFQLPPEKYEQWKEVEMTFDASGGRIR